MATVRASSRRAASVGVALVLCSSAFACGDDEPEAINNLEFFSVDANNQPIALLDAKITTPGHSYGWTRKTLSPQLTGHPVDDVLVRYFSTSDRTEAHVFTFDPSARAAALRSIAVKEQVGAAAPANWDFLFTDPKHGTKVTLPYDVVVPFPNAAATVGQPIVPDSDRSELLLGLSHFVDKPPNKLQSDLANIKGHGSVKSVRVYDHGACSRPFSVESRLNKEVDNALDGFTATLKTIDGRLKPVVHYLRAAVFLDHGDPKDPTDLRDGLFVDAHLTIKAPAGHPDIDVWAFLNARFILADGILGLEYDTPKVKVHHDCCISFVTNKFVKEQVLLALGKIWENLVEEGNRAQKVNIPTPLGTCNPAAKDPCAVARGLLVAAVGNGALEYNHYLPASNPDYLLSADRDALRATVESAQWECSLTAQDEVYTCKYFIPIKRFNIYPDQVEAVWFDGKEVKNPAYAAWVASHADSSLVKGASQQMCRWDPKHQGEYFYNRSFAWVRR